MSTKEKLIVIVLCTLMSVLIYGVLLLYFAQLVYFIRHGNMVPAWFSIISGVVSMVIFMYILIVNEN